MYIYTSFYLCFIYLIIVKMAMAHATVALLTTLAATLCISSTSAAKILVYPFGHCLNSHLLNAEKVLITAKHLYNLCSYNDDYVKVATAMYVSGLSAITKPICEIISTILLSCFLLLTFKLRLSHLHCGLKNNFNTLTN